MASSFAIFALAAFFGICRLFSVLLLGLSRKRIAVIFVGVASLISFAFALMRVDSAFAGRAYAAYREIYIAAWLIWLWAVEGRAPTRVDLAGAGLATAGALDIGFATRTR